MDFNIIPATMEDDQKMYDFLMEQYYPDEPVNVASKRTLPVDKEHCGPVQMLKYNMSILAVKKDDPVNEPPEMYYYVQYSGIASLNYRHPIIKSTIDLSTGLS